MKREKNAIPIHCSHCNHTHYHSTRQLSVYFNKKLSLRCKNCHKRFVVTVDAKLFNQGASPKPTPDLDYKTAISSKGFITVVKDDPKVRNHKLPYLHISANEFCQQQELRLSQGINIVGRGPHINSNGAKINIDCSDLKMSREHCKITVEGDEKKGFQAFISDNESLNSTFINEKPMAKMEEIKLLEEDIVRIGKTNLKIVYK